MDLVQVQMITQVTPEKPMHKVVRAHVEDFRKRFSSSNDLSRDFEAFVNYAIFKSFSADSVNPEELIYSGDDPGIDGIMFFIDDTYVSSSDEASDIFKNRRRDFVVTVAFTQSKTGESWDKKEINAFESAIIDFLSEESEYPHSDYVQERKELFDTIIRNVGKLVGGKPRVHCFFATTARESEDREIVSAFKALRKAVSDTGYFSNIDVTPLNRDSLTDYWNAADGPVEATLPVIAMAAFPKAPEIEEGYVVTVRADEFIKNILSDENGRLRQRIFEENVRDFIGLDGEVNSEMTATISDLTKQKRFGILNNGVTLISPDVRVQGNEMYLRDFQIVNGCQTSNVLYEHRSNITSDATLMLKVVETSDASIVDDIVRSTNRQAKVEEDQFLATLDCVKGIEKFFNARGADEDHRLYFERRTNQFSGHEIPAIRIFDIREAARCVGAMFLDRPEIASRYPNRLTGDMRQLVFKRENIEDIYYVSAYTLYRLRLLMGNQRIDPRYGKLRWHILMAIKYYVQGQDVPQLGSPKIRRVCNEIEAFIGKSDDDSLSRLKLLCSSIVDIDDINRDKLKSTTLVQEVKQRALTLRKSDLKNI